MNRFKSILISATLLFSTLTTAHAEYIKLADSSIPADKVTVGKIFFSSGVSRTSSINLTKAIDDLNRNYKKLEKIYLYIDSYGGDMDSGKIAYWVVKSSRVPVTTVNWMSVMSSATMIFCGGSVRQAMPEAQFIMHAPHVRGPEAGDNIKLQPNDLYDYTLNVRRLVKMFSDVYKECSNFTDADLAGTGVLYTEEKKISLLPDEAKKRGIISGIANKIVDTPVAFYITD